MLVALVLNWRGGTKVSHRTPLKYELAVIDGLRASVVGLEHRDSQTAQRIRENIFHRDCALCFAAGGSAEAEAAGGELSDWEQRHAVLVLSRAKVGFPAGLVSRGHFLFPGSEV
jgi:hypothetical protein